MLVLSWETKVTLKIWCPSYFTNIITFTTTILDPPFTSSKSRIFEITCHVSSSIMGKGSIISSITSSCIIPLEIPFPYSISTLKTPTVLSSTFVGLLLGLYARWVGLARYTVHWMWNHACREDRDATCVSNLASLVSNMKICLQYPKSCHMKPLNNPKHILQ